MCWDIFALVLPSTEKEAPCLVGRLRFLRHYISHLATLLQAIQQVKSEATSFERRTEQERSLQQVKVQAALLLEPEGSANQLVLQISVVVGSGYVEFVKSSVGDCNMSPGVLE